MKPLYKGLLLAALQIALVASLGIKLLHDRASCPRVWARTANYDPDMPIRGRYVSLSVEVTPEGFSVNDQQSENKPYGYYYGYYRKPVKLEVKDDKLVAVLSKEHEGSNIYASPRVRYVQGKAIPSQEIYVDEPVAFFIPEHALNPAWLNRGEELWVEVTVPKKGPPRPIRLGIKKDNVLKPLNVD